MPKVAFLINSMTSGGAERVMSIIVNELCRQGNEEIELICLEKNNFYPVDDRVKITYLSESDGSGGNLKKLLGIPFLAWKLNRYVRRNNIALVQSHIYRANFVNAVAKYFGGRHRVQMVNAGQVSMYRTKGFMGRVNLFLIRRLYPLADTVVCKSRGMEVDLRTHFRTPPQTVVINNPYDISRIEELAGEEVHEFVFDASKKYLVYIGRFASFKRPDHVIRALPLLERNVELLLLGDGPRREVLQQLADTLDVQERVHFAGRVANPYKYMAKADAFILSSEDGEGFPNVLAEAMACRLPAISSDCKSGPREILSPHSDVTLQLTEENETAAYGILFPIGKHDKIAEAVNTVLHDEVLRKRLISEASVRVQDFSLEHIIQRYKKVLTLE